MALFEESKALESLDSEGKKMARGSQASIATIPWARHHSLNNNKVVAKVLRDVIDPKKTYLVIDLT